MGFDGQNIELLSSGGGWLAFVSFAWPLFLAAALAGFVDSIGGGGGLITLPTLLGLGVPVPLLLGTNKCLSTFGSLPAVVRYARAGLLPKLHGGVWVLLFAAAAGTAALGARASQHPWVLDHLPVLVPCLLFLVMGFMLKRWFWDEPRQRKRNSNLDPRQRHDFDSEERIQKHLFHPLPLTTTLLIAAYDGLLGPGTGTFFLNAFERLGLGTITANAMTKIFNLASNVGALLWFASQGRLIWTLGLGAACFYLCGSYLGSGLVLRRGQKLVRLVVLSTTSVLLIKLLWQNLP